MSHTKFTASEQLFVKRTLAAAELRLKDHGDFGFSPAEVIGEITDAISAIEPDMALDLFTHLLYRGLESEVRHRAAQEMGGRPVWYGERNYE